MLHAEWPNQQRAQIVPPHWAMRSRAEWRKQQIFASQVLKTYVVSALDTCLCKVEYFGLIFAWLELGLQLVLFKVNQEMLFIYAYVAETQDAAHMNVNQRRKPKILKFFNWFNFFADIFFMRYKTSFKAK